MLAQIIHECRHEAAETKGSTSPAHPLLLPRQALGPTDAPLPVGFSQGAWRDELMSATFMRAGELLSRLDLYTLIFAVRRGKPNEKNPAGREDRPF